MHLETSQIRLTRKNFIFYEYSVVYEEEGSTSFSSEVKLTTRHLSSVGQSIYVLGLRYWNAPAAAAMAMVSIPSLQHIGAVFCMLAWRSVMAQLARGECIAV
jgi:hypothetical protein